MSSSSTGWGGRGRALLHGVSTAILACAAVAIILAMYLAVGSRFVDFERAQLQRPDDVNAAAVLGAVQSWAPNGLSRVGSPIVAKTALPGCQAATTYSWGTDKTPTAQVVVVPCLDLDGAQGVAAVATAGGSPYPHAQQSPEVVVNPDTEVSVSTTPQRGILYRAWSRGPFAYVVRAQCDADVATCDAVNAEQAKQVSALLPPVDVDRSTQYHASAAAVLLAFIVAGAVLCGLIVVPRIITRRRRVKPVGGLLPQAIDVSARAAFNTMARVLRGTGLFVLLLCAVRVVVALLLMKYSNGDSDLKSPLVWAGIVIGFLMWRFGQRRLRKVDARRAQLFGTAPKAIVGRSLMTASRIGLLLIILLLSLTAVGGLLTVGGSELNIEIATIDAATHPPFRVLPALPFLYAMVVTRQGFWWLMLLLLIGAMALILLMNLGRRLAAASLSDEVKADTRPHVLLLRSFEEDQSRVVAHLLRPSVLPLGITPVPRVSLEQVLAHGLRSTAPAVAITPPGTSLPQLGAAKASFLDSEWRVAIKELSAEALAIVVQATPSSVTKEGFGWELDLLSTVIQHDRLIVVLGPYEESERDRRWAQFCRFAQENAAMSELARVQPPHGLRVAARSTERTWELFDGPDADDATYLAALSAATDSFEAEWRAELAVEGELRSLLKGCPEGPTASPDSP